MSRIIEKSYVRILHATVGRKPRNNETRNNPLFLGGRERDLYPGPGGSENCSLRLMLHIKLLSAACAYFHAWRHSPIGSDVLRLA